MRHGAAMVRLFLALIALTLALPAQAAEGDVVFTHVNVVPMDRERVLRDVNVVVSGGRIVAVGRDTRPPAGARVIDGGRRLWLSPGLADMHVHSDTRDDLAVYLANGVTTIATMGDVRASFVGRTTPASNDGRIPGPSVYNAFIVDGSPAYGHFTAPTPELARAAVALAKSNGYRFIKVYNNLSPAVFAALADEGKRLGLPLVGHGVTKIGLRAQAAAGQVLVAHAEEFFYTFFSAPGEAQTDAPPPDARIAEAVDFAKRSGIAVGADLVTYDIIARQIGHPEVVEAFLTAPSGRYVAPANRLGWRRDGYVAKTANLARRYAFLERMVKAMANGGVELLAGTDAPVVPGAAPGFALHDDLALLERAGLTRFQALATATRAPGRFLSRTIGELPSGTITPGARADLILSDANPLDRLDTLRRPLGVMVRGRWHDAAALKTMLDGVAAAYATR